MPGKPSPFLAVLLAGALAFTAVPAYAAPQAVKGSGEPVIERGWKILPLDMLAWVLAIPDKVLLWNRKFKNRNVSDETLQHLREYMVYYRIEDVKVRVNKAAFVDEYRRLFMNDKMHWLIRIFPGFFITTYSLLLERITAGDYYNPFNDTIHIFSDIPAVVLHEAGHARDFDRQSHRGFYALMRVVPGMDIIQEDEASTTAVKYLMEKQDRKNEIEAYKILYPAYGTYMGSYFNIILPLNLGSLGAILGGHWIGRKTARDAKLKYEHADERLRRQDEFIEKQKAARLAEITSRAE